MEIPPRSPADPRHGNRPFYIEPVCPTCQSELVLADRDLPDEEIWHDEWECPVCQDGIHMDWPASEIVALKKQAAEYVRSETFVPIEQALQELEREE